MTRAPWFRFNATEFLTSTRTMKPADVGVFIVLIALMHDRGEPLFFDAARLSRYCNTTKAAFGKTVERLVADGLVTVEGGKIWSEIIQREIDFREEKSEKAKSSAHKRHRKIEQNQSSAYANALLEETEEETEEEVDRKPPPGPSGSTVNSDDISAPASAPSKGASVAPVNPAPVQELTVDADDDLAELIEEGDDSQIIVMRGDWGDNDLETYLHDMANEEAADRLMALYRNGFLTVGAVRAASRANEEAAHG